MALRLAPSRWAVLMHRPFVFNGAPTFAYALAILCIAPLFLMALRLAPLPFTGPAFIVVNYAPYRREPVFSLELLDFLSGTFLKSGSICPANRQNLPVCGNFCRVRVLPRQFSPGPIYLAGAKSMFNQILPPFGTSFASSYAGKTPKEHCSIPRTERPK
jgi:hypothetical protein